LVTFHYIINNLHYFILRFIVKENLIFITPDSGRNIEGNIELIYQ